MGLKHVTGKDPMGRYVPVYLEVMNSVAWKALSFSAKCLYFETRKRMHSYNNGCLTATLAELKHDGFPSPSTIAKCLRELEVAGFMVKTRQGGIANGGKSPSFFRFTERPVLGDAKRGVAPSPATYDWRRFTTKAEADKAIKAAHLSAKRPVKRSENGSKPQRLKRIAPGVEPDDRQTDTQLGPEGKPKARKVDWRVATAPSLSH